jgi:hypothetical protein
MNFLLRRLYHDENGQSLYLAAGGLVALLAIAGLVIDLGWAYHAQRELQASADAAATAGALDLPYNPTATAVADATTASGLKNDENAVNDLSGVKMVNGSPLVQCWQACNTTTPGKTGPGYTTNCLPNISTPPACSYYDSATKATVTTGNVMVVQETGTSPSFFSKVFGFTSFTINVTSVALAKQANALPINIMMVVDSTASMGSSDPNCWSGLSDAPTNWPSGYGNPTREDCAKWGLRSFLVNLNSSVQNVGVATFPPVTNDGAEYDCSSPRLSTGNGGIVGYNSILSDSLVVSLSGGYLNSSGALNTSSDVVGTVYWTEPAGNTCSTPNYGLQDPGGEGTYYAQAINEATLVLNAHPGVTSAIVVLGDGTINYDSYSTGKSGDTKPCTSAINAATAATGDGISVYSVGYGIPNPNTSTGGDFAQSGGSQKPPSSQANCGPGDATLTPCAVMQQIASTYGSSGNSNFYADAESTANGCASSNNSGLTDLGSIFSGLAEQFGTTRLLPGGQYQYVPPS